MRTQFTTKRTKIRSITPMNRNTLNDFRHEIYRCFGKAKDALFNLVDALGSCAGARSFPELSLSPLFERTWARMSRSPGRRTDRRGAVARDLCPVRTAAGERPGSLFGHRYQQPLSPGSRDRCRSHIGQDGQSAREDPCGQSRLGHQQCRAPAQASQSRHLRAGYGTCAFDGTSH